jgi:hypothetical protein
MMTGGRRMSLETFREITTPESRMHRALLLVGLIGAAGCAWQWWVGSRYSVETAAGATVAAYAVWRFSIGQKGEPW